MDKEEKSKKIIALVLVIAVIILGLYKLFFEGTNIKKEKIDTETISIVRDNDRFYTVSSCASKYINYLSIKDTDNLLILLSEDFKTKKSVNYDNIYSYIGTLDGTKNFVAKKMYEQRVSKNVYKYYVYGYIDNETIYYVSNKQDYYLIVLLDEENMVFAIEPYDGEIFTRS